MGHSILVVDDEESIRELVRDGLSARGATVDLAATGEEALVRMTQRPYDAVLCDLNLGGADIPSGRDFRERSLAQARALHQDHQPLFLFMTGDLVDRATSEEFASTGARALQKPFRISELISILSDALSDAPSTAPSAPNLRPQ